MRGGPPGAVITLVHGTFAPRAPWTLPGSKLRTAIERALPGEQVRFVRLEWRGFLRTALNNGHRYRLAAGHRLAAQLEAQCRQYPDARHFVVAHSHGGNVALYAVSRMELAARLSGIACLGTPFIRCQPRELERAIATFADIAWFALAAPVLVCLALFGEPAMRAMPGQTVLLEGYGLRVTTLSLLLLVGFVAGIPVYVGAYRRSVGLLFVWAKKSQQAVLERLALPRHARPPLFCAAVQGDEARRHLWWVSATGDVPYWLWRVIPYVVVLWLGALALMVWPEYLPGMLRDPYQFMKDFAAHYWPADLAAWQPRTEWDRRYDQLLTRSQPVAQMAGAFIAGLAITVTLQALHLVIMAAVPRLLRSNPFGFGQETVLDNVLAIIDVTDAPPGFPVDKRQYTVEQAGLRHSAVYDDDQVLDDLGSFIAGNSR